ncbi:MAG: Lipid A biosynthesis palmitoleoyltransferase [Gemmatimonadaceae bacterium]|nr:Lipid A biosynthesis palmitoleoyltransferase [Gemmatimonadaceae bacterium]
MASVRHRLEYVALRAVLALFAALPLSVASRLGEFLGLAGYWPLGIRRRVVTRQIAAAFPGLPAREVARVARGAYRNLGRTTVESAVISGRSRADLLAMFEGTDDWTPVSELLAAGKGSVLVTGHFGNWELAAAYVAARGVPLDVIARRQANPLFDAYITRTRQRLGLTVVHDRDAARHIPRAFREGRSMGFVADQGVKGLASTFVPFFGRPAKTPRGPAVYALKYKLPLIAMAGVRQPSGKYRLLIDPIDVTESGNREEDVDALVAAFTAVLERHVRRYPDQYFWHHRRWRRQPPSTPEELREPL